MSLRVDRTWRSSQRWLRPGTVAPAANPSTTRDGRLELLDEPLNEIGHDILRRHAGVRARRQAVAEPKGTGSRHDGIRADATVAAQLPEVEAMVLHDGAQQPWVQWKLLLSPG